jgi:hypothetical protein
MEDNTAPLGDVASGTMVEAGGGEQTDTADRQNQQGSTNSSRATKRRADRHSSRVARTTAEQHGQRGGAPLAVGRREGEPHQRATSINDVEKECSPYPPRRSKQQREKRGDLEEGRGRKVDVAG